MNSRPYVNNHAQLAALAASCATAAADSHMRAVVFVITPPVYWLEQFASEHGMQYLDPDSTTDRADQVSALLGSERTAAVVQLGAIPDLGLLAALAGTLVAGGLLIIGINDTSDSASFSALRLSRIALQVTTAHVHCTRYVTFTAESVGRLTRAAPSASASLRLGITPSDPEKKTALAYQETALTEQNRLFAAACEHLASNQQACIVIRGRRGHGKSTLMARIAAQLLADGEHLRITAMHASALNSYQKLNSRTQSLFTSPEAAIDHAVDVLLVDEAASFPLKHLLHYLSRHRIIVLCTTTDGYEAAGRALDVRLLAEGCEPRLQMVQLEPLQPWRWAPEDPLELLINRLLLRTELTTVRQTAELPSQRRQTARRCVPMRISRNDLLHNEPLLASVHALLSATHYQTTTKDIAHLLDAPTLTLWIQMLDDQVVGILLAEYEGEIDSGLHEPILARQRRLTNQLLPQLLAQVANCGDALTKRYLRVLRIATHPDLRRCGLASQLLERATSGLPGAPDMAGERAADAIGASFASDTVSLAFWKRHGFLEFHQGFRKNPRTGRQAVAVMRTSQTECLAVLNRAVQIHAQNECTRTNKPMRQAPSQESGPRAVDVQLLRRFAAGQRNQHDTRGSLARLAAVQPLPLLKPGGQSARQHEQELRTQVQRWIEAQ